MPSGNCAIASSASRPSFSERQIYASFWFEHEDLAHTIELVGEDKVMFETDFPHPTCLYDDIDERVDETGRPR